jgi:hypothetical protein
VSRPRLLLVPFVTELEYEKLRPQIDSWAELATYDPPGIGAEPANDVLAVGPRSADPGELLARYREAIALRGIEEAERAGWDRFFLVSDSYGNGTAVRIAELAKGRVLGLALGHATLVRTGEGERPTIVREVFDAMGMLLRTDRESFIAAAVAQLTQGAVDTELAQRWLERFPDSETVNAIWDALAATTEPLDERLASLGLPLLAGEHVGCLVETREGFEDFAAAFPRAKTVACPQACLADPAFAEALREFCLAA